MRTLETVEGFKFNVGKSKYYYYGNSKLDYYDIIEPSTTFRELIDYYKIDPTEIGVDNIIKFKNGDTWNLVFDIPNRFTIRIKPKGESVFSDAYYEYRNDEVKYSTWSISIFYNVDRGTVENYINTIQYTYQLRRQGSGTIKYPVLPFKGIWRNDFEPSEISGYYAGGYPKAADSNTYLYSYITTIPDIEPPKFGPDSDSGGGNGSFDGTGDDIGIPELPTLSAVDTGFISVYAPTGDQMKALASYMWSDLFSLDTFKKLFADPMEVILGLSILPVAVPTDGQRSVKIGFVDTGVSMNHAAGQYVTVDCGTLDVQEFWGSALDYSPYTKFSLYLPYIGTRQINTDDIMGKSLQIVYHIDIVSGACTAMVKCGDSVLYEFSGACATQIPVTGRDWGRTLSSMVQLAGAGITAAATAGASLPISAGKAAGMAVGYTASHVTSAKPDVQRSGAVSGAAGMLGVQVPYLIAELPRQSRAKDYGAFLGYPCNITAKLADMEGYTEVASIHLDGLSGATTEEIADIEQRLKEGVIF